MTRVKICGITNLEDALAAVEAGADALGFVFAPSPRRLTPQEAKKIIERLPPLVTRVGVFVDEPVGVIREVMETCGLDLAQLHGSESPEDCLALFPRVIKSFSVKDETVLELIPRYRAVAYLLDSYHPELKGGSGQGFNWSIAREAKRFGPVILAGGLTPENVGRAVEEVGPYAVDVSSGVEERPGRKNHALLRAFIAGVRGAEPLKVY